MGPIGERDVAAGSTCAVLGSYRSYQGIRFSGAAMLSKPIRLRRWGAILDEPAGRSA